MTDKPRTYADLENWLKSPLPGCSEPSAEESELIAEFADALGDQRVHLAISTDAGYAADTMLKEIVSCLRKARADRMQMYRAAIMIRMLCELWGRDPLQALGGTS